MKEVSQFSLVSELELQISLVSELELNSSGSWGFSPYEGFFFIVCIIVIKVKFGVSSAI